MNISASDIAILNSLNATHVSKIKQPKTELTHTYLGTSIVLGELYRFICIDIKGADHIDQFINLKLSKTQVHHTGTLTLRTPDHAQFFYKLDTNQNKILIESCFTNQTNLLNLNATATYHGQMEFKASTDSTAPTYQIATKADPCDIPNSIWVRILNYTYNLYDGLKSIMSSPTDTNIVKYYLKRYPNTTVFDISNNRLYFATKTNVWVKDTTSATTITTKLTDVLREFKRHCKNWLKCDVDQDDPTEVQEAQAHLTRIKQYVNSNRSRITIINQLKLSAPQVNFKDHKQPACLFAFDNAVYDLEHHMIRLANHSEYVTMTCGYNYLPLYSDATIEIVHDKINSFIGLLTQDGSNSNLMNDLALLLGNTDSTTYHVYLGQGDIKPVLVSLLQGLLNEYCMTILANQLDIRRVLKLNQYKTIMMNLTCDFIMTQARQQRLQSASSVIISSANQVAIENKVSVTCTFDHNDLQHQQLVNDFDKPNIRMVLFHVLVGHYTNAIVTTSTVVESAPVSSETTASLPVAPIIQAFLTSSGFEITNNSKDHVRSSLVRKSYKQYCNGKLLFNKSQLIEAMTQTGFKYAYTDGIPMYRGLKHK